MPNKELFVEDGSVAWEDLGDGVKRKIMAYDDHLMLVKIAFQQDAIGTIHNHVHSQITYVVSGVFEVTIDDEKKILQKGDVFRVPSGDNHGVRCMEEGILIDVFSPMREDFVTTPHGEKK